MSDVSQRRCGRSSQPDGHNFRFRRALNLSTMVFSPRVHRLYSFICGYEVEICAVLHCARAKTRTFRGADVAKLYSLQWRFIELRIFRQRSERNVSKAPARNTPAEQNVSSPLSISFASHFRTRKIIVKFWTKIKAVFHDIFL